MISTLYARFWNDSLFRNALYLMSATAVLAVFGFFFWLINARLFSEEEVGFATTLISIMNLIALISLIGFNASFVRFLPSEDHPSTIINTGLIAVTIAAIIISCGFLLILPFVAPSLNFLHSTFPIMGAFVLFCVFNALNTLTDSVFLSHRESRFILVVNGVFSFLRLTLPFLFIGYGALGIFAAAGVAQGIGLILSLIIMGVKFGYRPQLIFNQTTLQRVWRYSATNYTASSLNLIPATTLPLIITNALGPISAAYYYIAMMIGNLLYVIPYATTRSLFAEGSNDETSFKKNIRATISIVTALMIPSIAFLLIFGTFILNLFGESYGAGGSELLSLIALTGIVVSATSIFNAYFQVQKDAGALIVMNAIYAIATLSFTYLLLSRGLVGIGIAWFLGNLVTSIAGYLLYLFPLHVWERYDAISYEIWTRVTCKIRYFRARRGMKGPPKVVLFYPEMPKYYYALYTVCHQLGYKMSNDPYAPYDCAVLFHDVTKREDDAVMKMLKARGPVINGDCYDISKEHVEDVFSEVFGYTMRIDPRTFVGECVQKSDENATHDGKVVMCPREPEKGYVYQKLINNREGDTVTDIRVKVCGTTTPFLTIRSRSAFDRFDNTRTSRVEEIANYISSDEAHRIMLFSKKMGIEWGALDTLRDRDNGKLYIVDANVTTGGPKPGFHCSYEEYEKYVLKLSTAFKNECMRI